MGVAVVIDLRVGVISVYVEHFILKQFFRHLLLLGFGSLDCYSPLAFARCRKWLTCILTHVDGP